MRLYGPAILLVLAAVWLMVFGDGIMFGVIVLTMLVMTCVGQARAQLELWRRYRRTHGR